uniref:Uncharacterized protein n=1 Tax=Anguilla anguilla TaxID=7936 RepID=A0A0E9RHX0_ANGAN
MYCTCISAGTLCWRLTSVKSLSPILLTLPVLCWPNLVPYIEF